MANIPQEFISTLEQYGSSTLDGLVESLALPPAVSVRCNTLKAVVRPTGCRPVAWCGNGFYLDHRQQFTFDPAMHQGLYYVQDASSMIISHIVKELTREASKPLTYLDACAAPGGKTTAAIDSLPSGSLVIANEYNSTRAAVLRENVIKWGYPACIVTRGDTARISRLENFFDIIATDVPCSGEGMFRKEPDAVAQWSRRLVSECAARQREIIDNVWSALKPGGYLIYSTCTFNRDENEEMVQYICDRYGAVSIGLPFPEDWHIAGGISTGHRCYRFLPHMVEGEGLFVSVMRKPDGNGMPSKVKKNRNAARPVKIPGQILKTACQWIADAEKYDFTVNGDNITAFPKMHSQAKDIIDACLDVIHEGVTVATIKGKDLIPSQSLLLSTALDTDAFPCHEVDYPTAIAYLRREAITLDDAPRGYVIVTYGNRPLGFVKNLGNRANNLYPQEWRILSSHCPDTPPAVIPMQG